MPLTSFMGSMGVSHANIPESLAAFNTQRGRDFLCEYLEYYLQKPDFWFDQSDAMAALLVLDERNGTELAATFHAQWEVCVRNKPNWDLPRHTDMFRMRLEDLMQLRHEVARSLFGGSETTS